MISSSGNTNTCFSLRAVQPACIVFVVGARELRWVIVVRSARTPKVLLYETKPGKAASGTHRYTGLKTFFFVSNFRSHDQPRQTHAHCTSKLCYAQSLTKNNR